MPNIVHVLSINAYPKKIYEAVTTREGLAGWWTEQVDARAEEGYVNTFRFGQEAFNKMKVEKLDPPSGIHWNCVDGAEEWVGTRVSFEIEPKEQGCTLRFTHANWKEETDFYGLCNHHWGRYLDSLKALVETGKGNPFTVP